MKRLAVAAAAAAAGLVLWVAPAGATDECRGLMVCVPVAGPWVVVPTGKGVPRPSVEYQLSCPRGFVVGGLDAELSSRGIDVQFRATLGSPVNPGISTSQAAVFSARFVGAAARAPTFRPHIGCLPATGGGVRVPTAAGPFPVGRPATLRVKQVDLTPGTARVVQACKAGESLVGASHAIGFYSVLTPSESLVRSVSAVRSVSPGTVSVDVRAGSAVEGVRTVVQVGALCAGGGS